MSGDVLKLSREEFLAAVQKRASNCKSREDLNSMEEFVEGLIDLEIAGENRQYQNKVLDDTLKQLDVMRGKNILSQRCAVDFDEEVIKVDIQNNVVVGFENIEKAE